MLRGVRVDGKLVRLLRRSKGWNQKTLATTSGVSERTVRNAEKSQVLETHIALYIAEALEVPLSELVAERPQPRRGQRLHRFSRLLGRSYLRAVIDKDHQPIMDLLHPNVEWNLCGAPADCVPMTEGFDGRASGKLQVIQYLRWMSKWWSKLRADSSRFRFQRTEIEGDMIYILLAGHAYASPDQSYEIWQSFVCRCEEDLLLSVDQCFGHSRVRDRNRSRTKQIPE